MVLFLTLDSFATPLPAPMATVCIRQQKLGIPNLHWQQPCGSQRGFARR